MALKFEGPVCPSCGAFSEAEMPGITEKIWHIFGRAGTGKEFYEPLVFTGEWVEENIFDDESHEAMIHAMERDMHNRGLCVTCGRPDLRRVDTSNLMSEEEYKDYCDMQAEMAAERRMGA